jgi:hypothetical protein
VARNFASTLYQNVSEEFEQTAEAYSNIFSDKIVVENTEKTLKRARNIKEELVL